MLLTLKVTGRLKPAIHLLKISRHLSFHSEDWSFSGDQRRLGGANHVPLLLDRVLEFFGLQPKSIRVLSQLVALLQVAKHQPEEGQWTRSASQRITELVRLHCQNWAALHVCVDAESDNVQHRHPKNDLVSLVGHE
jgi:hypothetical protein